MAERHDSHAPYTVGYGKPPRATQFRPGQSGNAKGRPKGSKTFVKLVEEELTERIRITENGKHRKITKKQGIAKQIVNQAVSGSLKAIARVLDETRAHENTNLLDYDKPKATKPIAKEYLKILSDEELVKLYRAAVARE
jgi:Family of unknown function (DUF5681)